MAQLTHLDETGAAKMVAVDQKEITLRRAVAQGELRVSAEVFRLIQAGDTPKGDVFPTARIAGIMAAKETSRLIPLCHPLNITGIEINFKLNESDHSIEVEACINALDRTGVEMEAMTAVSVAMLTLYDMLKAIDLHMTIDQVRLIEKSGGRRDFNVGDEDTASVAPEVQESGGLWPVKVIGKQPTPTREVILNSPHPLELDPSSAINVELLSGEYTTGEELIITDFDDLSADSDDEGLITSCAPSLIQLLTPSEPIPALKQPAPLSGVYSSVDSELSADRERDQPIDWDDSILADPDEFEEPPISRPEHTEALSERVKEVSLDYPPLRRFIVDKPVECAYLLGYLSPEFTSRSRAFILEDEVNGSETRSTTQVRALLFVYSGLTLPTIWTYGGDLDVEAILRFASSELPRRIYLNIEDRHVGVMRGFYALRGRRALLRMGLHRDQYRPFGDTAGVIELGHRDTAGIMGLFQRYYPDHLFEPAQLDSGLYRGLKSSQDQLIAVAGIHLLNPEYRVAAIGNIVTDEEHRGRGHATRCVQHILDQLFVAVDHVALNVVEDNAPAIHCYRKFGFQTTTRLIEAQASMLS